MSTPTTTTSILHLTSIPPSSHIGLDLSSFSSTPQFAGIKSLPPGLHHIWVSTAPGLSLRYGFWLHIPSAPPVQHHRRYDPATEALVADDDLLPAITPELWTSGLTPYRQRLPSTGEETPAADAWNALVRHVTPHVLTRVLGEGWSADSTSGSVAGEVEDTAGLPGDDGGEERRLGFTAVDLKRTWREGAQGSERTEMARDRSWMLGEVLAAAEGELLGEFELAFVVCYYLGNYAAAEHWMRVVRLVLTCRNAAVGEREPLFVEFLAELRCMLEVLQAGEGPGFIGEDQLNEVLGLLRRFGKMLREEEEEDPSKGAKVRREFERLKDWAGKRMDWVLDTREMLRRGMVMTEEGDMVEVEAEGLEEEEETGEYAPVIVEDVDLPSLEDVDVSSSRGSSPVDIMLVDEEEGDPRF
jgi:A1 cistron-splicing factor AAR2